MIVKEIKSSCLLLEHRDDINILIARWQKKVPDPEIQSGYLETLNLAVELKARYWLYDVRGRGFGGSNDYWVLNYFFPKVKEALKETVFLAYLLAPSHYDKVVPRIPNKEVSAYNDIIQVKMFVSEQEALFWLQEKQV